MIKSDKTGSHVDLTRPNKRRTRRGGQPKTVQVITSDISLQPLHPQRIKKILNTNYWCFYSKKNQSTPRPSEHPGYYGGKNVKTFS